MGKHALEFLACVQKLPLLELGHIIIRRNNQIHPSTGIRQGDYLSPVLCNLIMKEIIKDVKNAGHGYRTNKGEIPILCYADDAVIISKNEDELQRHYFINST